MRAELLIEPVSLMLLGEPNPKISSGNDWRFGRHGSLSVNVEKNTFYDHETSHGGGVIDLITNRLSIACRTTAINWYRENIDRNLQAAPFSTSPKPRRENQSKTFAYSQRLLNEAHQSDYAIADHPYAIKKGVYWGAGALRGAASGRLIGKDADCLLIPMTDLNGTPKGVECINPQGAKQTFGNKGVLILGNDLDNTLEQLVVEGWATAARMMHIFKGHVAIYACFGKGNARQVAFELEKKYPERSITVCEESDD